VAEEVSLCPTSYAEKPKDGMSAEILGRDLLAEVEEESLNEVGPLFLDTLHIQ